ncbi:MAG TPA: UrcA family protein [Gammaproteobacteria bacterium]|nr:UrcA family protein [Gammaproteobacteria bacterium]
MAHCNQRTCRETTKSVFGSQTAKEAFHDNFSSFRSATFRGSVARWSTASIGAPRVGEIATTTVKVADLDISTASGAETLYKRIVTAARVVCFDTDVKAMHACRARAVADAVARVGSPLLSAAHRSTIERAEEVVRR